jgi:hypothetical protein
MLPYAETVSGKVLLGNRTDHYLAALMLQQIPVI